MARSAPRRARPARHDDGQRQQEDEGAREIHDSATARRHGANENVDAHVTVARQDAAAASMKVAACR